MCNISGIGRCLGFRGPFVAFEDLLKAADGIIAAVKDVNETLL